MPGLFLLLLLQAFDPLNPGAPPAAPRPPASAPTPAPVTAGRQYLPRPASYAWPDLWPINYEDDPRRNTRGPAYWDLPTTHDPSHQKAYLDFPQQTIMGGQNPPGHRPEDFRDFGPNGVAGRIGEMKLGEFETWDGRAMKPIYKMVPYKGRFEIVGATPVGAYACKQVKFTMSRPKSSVSLMNLYCQYPDGRWGKVT